MGNSITPLTCTFLVTKYASNAPYKLFLYHRYFIGHREYQDGKDLFSHSHWRIKKTGRGSHLGKQYSFLREKLCKGAGSKAGKQDRILLAKLSKFGE